MPDCADNCPGFSNAGQANNDGNFILLPHPRFSFDDLTRAMSDNNGDVCDTDLDNDGLRDSLEVGGVPCASAAGPTNPLLADTDGDRVLDGAECALGTDPTNPSLANDPGRDGLSSAFEVSIGTDLANVDGDNDGLPDGLEFKFYGTNPAVANSDGDTCNDGAEVASVNSDSVVNVLDLQHVAGSLSTFTGDPLYVLDFDVNKDGSINVIDLQFVARRLDSW